MECLVHKAKYKQTDRDTYKQTDMHSREHINKHTKWHKITDHKPVGT